jgi:hypothetical protein
MNDYLRSHSLVELCAEQWRQSVINTFEQTKSMDTSRLHVLTYESFVNDPDGELSKILAWLKVEIPEDMSSLLKGVSTSSIGKYQSQLSKDDIARIEPIIIPVLDDIKQKEVQE